MCGIAGYFGCTPPEKSQITQSLNSLHHRGPDARGGVSINVDDLTVELLHTRLEIIDLKERSNQPFKLKNLHLIFNGEIYNYRELRRRLMNDGCSFSTNSDTEVLAWVLLAWGRSGLNELEGMWSFACFDEDSKELWLCRDRFGEKPLHFLTQGHGVTFASEIPSLNILSGKKLRPNISHLARYLVNGYRALYKTSENFFMDVERVANGQLIVIREGKVRETWQYWSPKKPSPVIKHYGDAVDAVKESLIRSVEISLRADVPIAFCLSGGVDSNAIASIAKNRLGYDVHGFTITNQDRRYEEQALIDIAINKQNLRHTSVPLATNSFLENLSEMVKSRGAPVATITFYAHWLLMQEVKKAGYKVSVSGTGADEIFSGYHDHHHFYLASVQNDADLFQSALQNWSQHQKKIVRNPFLQDPLRIVKDPKARSHIFLNRSDFLNSLIISWDEPFTEEGFCDDPLRNRMMNEMFHESVPLLLNEDDLNAMHFSIENRSPFLNRGLYELVQGVPTSMLMQDGFTKSLLRDALTGIVPEEIIRSRRKVGFNAPLSDLFSPDDKSSKEFLLDGGPVFDFVSKPYIESLLNSDLNTNSKSKFLFNFINIKLFYEHFCN